MLICDKCHSRISENSRFCPQCADPVTEADISKQVDLQDGIKLIKLTFGYSSSPQYKRAVELCTKVPSYARQGEGRKEQHTLVLPITELELVITIWEIIGGWKASTLIIDGVKSSKRDLVYGCLGCYRERNRAKDPERYCYGGGGDYGTPFGCHQLGMELGPTKWMTHGVSRENGRSWNFDKSKIKDELIKRLSEVDLCPAITRSKAFHGLEQLPDEFHVPKIGETQEVTFRWNMYETQREIEVSFYPPWEIGRGAHEREHSDIDESVREEVRGSSENNKKRPEVSHQIEKSFLQKLLKL